jgi:hypothetical protein
MLQEHGRGRYGGGRSGVGVTRGRLGHQNGRRGRVRNPRRPRRRGAILKHWPLWSCLLLQPRIAAVGVAVARTRLRGVTGTRTSPPPLRWRRQRTPRRRIHAPLRGGSLLRPRSDIVGVAVTRTRLRGLTGTRTRPVILRRPLLLRPRSDIVGVAVGRTRLDGLSGTHVRPPPRRRPLLLQPPTDTVGVAVTRTRLDGLTGTRTRPVILRRGRRFFRRAPGLRPYRSGRHRPTFGGWGIGRVRAERCGGAGPFGGRRAFGVSGRLRHLTEGGADSSQHDRERRQQQQRERTDVLVTCGPSLRRLQMPDRFAQDLASNPLRNLPVQLTTHGSGTSFNPKARSRREFPLFAAFLHAVHPKWLGFYAKPQRMCRPPRRAAQSAARLCAGCQRIYIDARTAPTTTRRSIGSRTDPASSLGDVPIDVKGGAGWFRSGRRRR